MIVLEHFVEGGKVMPSSSDAVAGRKSLGAEWVRCAFFVHHAITAFIKLAVQQ